MAAAQFTLYLNNCNVTNAVRQGLIDQGIDTCDSFLGYNDGDMKAVCRRMIQPGGTIPGRGAAAGRANKGIPVSFVAEINLRKACFYRNYMHRIQRPFMATALVAFSFKEFLFSLFSLPFEPYFPCSCSCRKTRKHDSEHFPCFPAPVEA